MELALILISVLLGALCGIGISLLITCAVEKIIRNRMLTQLDESVRMWCDMGNHMQAQLCYDQWCAFKKRHDEEQEELIKKGLN